MRIALAQIDPTVGDLRGNSGLIIQRARQARAEGSDLVVFPELCVCGYPPEDLVLKDYFVADCMQAVVEVAVACPDMPLVVGAPLCENGVVHNAAAILSAGAIAGWYRKILLPNYAVFDEKRNFAPGERAMVVRVGQVNIGITICEDIWEADGPGETTASLGRAAVILNLSMSPYHMGKGHERESMLAERAKAAGAYVCYVNGVGGQDELVFDGQSLAFDPEGRLLARAAQFEEELLLVDIEPRMVEAARGAAPLLAAGHPEEGTSEACGPGPWAVDVISVKSGGKERGARRSAAEGCLGATAGRAVRDVLSPEGEVYGALCLGVRDYTLKNGFQQAVLGLSGGIDSALTACIAADALGSDRVTTVSMPSRFSSVGTRNDARETAERLGVHYHEIPIESIYGSYLESLEPYLAGGAPGVTEQNIQARIRGNLLMALSNKAGWLVLTTGNKSETAVGYATLYGDMAGGFAVLKDVPKTLVYRLARYRNSLGSGEGPVPESTLERAPSAELAADQTDQDTLPPYDVLDRIIDAYVVRDDSLEEIVALGIDRAVVQRVLAMIDGNEYKRRQAAPGVRITPKAFGKDRRLPITNRYHG